MIVKIFIFIFYLSFSGNSSGDENHEITDLNLVIQDTVWDPASWQEKIDLFLSRQPESCDRSVALIKTYIRQRRYQVALEEIARIPANVFCSEEIDLSLEQLYSDTHLSSADRGDLNQIMAIKD